MQREVLAQRVTKEGYRVSDAAVIKAIHDIPAFQADGKFDYASYERMVTLQGYSTTSFEAYMRSDLSVQQLQAGLQRSSFVTPEELRRRIELEDEQREIAYAVFSRNGARSRDQVPDADVQTSYEARKAEFVTPETVSIQYVELRADALSSGAGKRVRGARPVRSGARDWSLQARGARPRTPAEGRQPGRGCHCAPKPSLVAARAGEDFATLARENSQDEVDREGRRRARMEWPRTRWSNPSATPCSPCSRRPSAIRSAPLRLSHHRAPRTSPAARRKPYQDVRMTRCSKAQAEARRLALLRSRAELGQRAFQSARFTGRGGAGGGRTAASGSTASRAGEGRRHAARSQPCARLAFTATLLEGGDNSDVIELGEGARLCSASSIRKPEAQRPLEEVRGEIEAELSAEGARAQADATASDVVAKLADGGSLEALTTEHGGEYHATGYVVRRGAPVELIKAVFAAPKPAEGAPYRGKVTLGNGGRAVFVLTTVHPGTAPTARRRIGINAHSSWRASAAKPTSRRIFPSCSRVRASSCHRTSSPHSTSGEPKPSRRRLTPHSRLIPTVL